MKNSLKVLSALMALGNFVICFLSIPLGVKIMIQLPLCIEAGGSLDKIFSAILYFIIIAFYLTGIIIATRVFRLSDSYIRIMPAYSIVAVLIAGSFRPFSFFPFLIFTVLVNGPLGILAYLYILKSKRSKNLR